MLAVPVEVGRGIGAKSGASSLPGRCQPTYQARPAGTGIIPLGTDRTILDRLVNQVVCIFFTG